MNYKSSSESGSEDYRYTGKQEDPSGLYYFGARYYDPLTGRFTTRDTVFGDLTDPQSQNRYVYCMNNPHKYTDPDGKEAITVGAVVAFGLLGGLVCMEAYVIDTYLSGGDIEVDRLVGTFTNGFIGAAGGALVGAAKLTTTTGKLVNTIVGATIEAVSGIYERNIADDETNWDMIASDSALGVITSNLPDQGQGVNTFRDAAISAKKDVIVDWTNEVSGIFIEHIRDTYTKPIEGTPISSYNERVDYWW